MSLLDTNAVIQQTEDYIDVEKLHDEIDHLKLRVNVQADRIKNLAYVNEELNMKLSDAKEFIDRLRARIDQLEVKWRGREDGVYFMKSNGVVRRVDVLDSPDRRCDVTTTDYKNTRDCTDIYSMF